MQPESRTSIVARTKQPFDHWLQKQLHELYDSITQEPLPDDLLKLIDNDAGLESKPAPASGKPRIQN
jgi:hypothetical protein